MSRSRVADLLSRHSNPRSAPRARRARSQAYEQHRSNLHESSYNLGRAAHQLGLLHIAQHYYERALAAGEALVQERRRQHGGEDEEEDREAATAALEGRTLFREIAHNLALIYRASGANALAKELYLKYLTV